MIGAVLAFQFAYGLGRFGGTEYVPRVIVLAALRAYAPAGAFVLTCLTAVTVVHRAARRPAPTTIEGRRASIVGAAIALFYPIDVACLCAGGLVVMRAVYELPAATFVASSVNVIKWQDAAFGATTTAAYALLATLLLPRLLRVVAASRRGLVAKLVVTWLVLLVARYGVHALAVAAWPADRTDASPGASSAVGLDQGRPGPEAAAAP